MYNAQHGEKEKNKKSPTNCRDKKALPTAGKKSILNRREEEPPQPQGHVKTQTNQVSANEHVKEGKDRGGSASQEPNRSSRATRFFAGTDDVVRSMC